MLRCRALCTLGCALSSRCPPTSTSPRFGVGPVKVRYVFSHGMASGALNSRVLSECFLDMLDCQLLPVFGLIDGIINYGLCVESWNIAAPWLCLFPSVCLSLSVSPLCLLPHSQKRSTDALPSARGRALIVTSLCC